MAFPVTFPWTFDDYIMEAISYHGLRSCYMPLLAQ